MRANEESHMSTIAYPAVLERGEETGCYGIWFPDLPGCVAVADDQASAFDQASEAAQFHVEGLVAEGQEPPGPSRIEDVKPEADAPGKESGVVALLLVPVRLPTRPVRVNVTIDGGLLLRIDEWVNRHGTSGGRSGFLAEAARERLRQDA
jgi:predicted RNase H-like HicB family nuclease